MNLQQFKTLLASAGNKHFRLRLPNGSPVPVSFHVTEVGRVQKTFIDCGGTLRESVACQLQVWVGEDVEHRLEAQKAAKILEKAKAFLPDESIPDSYAMVQAFADQLRTDDTLNFTNRMMADLLSIDAAWRIDEANSSTILVSSFPASHKAFEADLDARRADHDKVYHRVFGKKAKPEVREKYLHILADEGEQAAMDWVLRQ